MTELPSPKKPWQLNQASSSIGPSLETRHKNLDEKQEDKNPSNISPPTTIPNSVPNPQVHYPLYDQPQLNAYNPSYPPMDYGAGAFGGGYSQPPMGYSGGGGYGFNSGYGGSMFNPYGQQMGMFGQPPMSFMSQMQMNTQPAFQVIERIVNTFSGFAQMLSSTYFATYSSFNAMVGVADQFAHLRNYLRNIFSLGSLLRSIQRYMYRLFGWKVKVHKDDLTFKEYQKFNTMNKVSFKPLVLFFVVTFGLPYLLHRVMKRMYQQNFPYDPRKQGSNSQQDFMRIPSAAMNSSKLESIEFAKATFDFVPKNNNNMELPMKKDELVAILRKTDDLGNPSNWWMGRTRDGKIGLFPNNYVQLLDNEEKDSAKAQLKEKETAK